MIATERVQRLLQPGYATELERRTQVLIQERFMVLELFCVAALYYLAMTTAWEFIQRAIERRFGRAYEQISAASEQR